MSRRFIIIALSTVVLLSTNAEAATIPVGTTADASAGQCTLRDAITAANTNSAAGACPAGSGPSDLIDLRSLTGTITLGSALPTIGTSVDIQGPGPSALTVSGGNAFGVFYVTGTASMSGLRIADGRCNFGCGIRNDGAVMLDDVAVEQNLVTQTGGTNAFPQGGGLSNTGTLTLTRSTVRNNSAVATGATSQNAPAGGGIFNNGGTATLTIDRSIVSGNNATATAGAGGTTNVNGGGISNSGTLNLTRSTVSANTAQAETSTTFNSATGGGISNGNAGSVHLFIDRSTISDNAASATGPGGATNNPQAGGFNVPGGVGSATISSSTIARNSAALGANVVPTAPAHFKNSIISSPLGGGLNCNGAGTSQGFNLTDGTGCGFTQASDRLSSNPMLAPGVPADNGGPTPTIALQAGSPAIDAGLSSAGETIDQRGGIRPYDFDTVANAAGGDGTDIGAFEVEDTTPPETTITSGPADGATIADRSPAFGFSSDDPAATFECRFDADAFGPCTSPASPSAPLGDGAHMFEVRATDTAGNVDGSPAVTSFTVDTTVPPAATAPETQLTKVPRTKIKTRAKIKKVRISFSSESEATFECRLDGGAFSPCKSPATFSLKRGKHVIEVRAVDSLGNTDATPARAAIKIKRKKPKKRR